MIRREFIQVAGVIGVSVSSGNKYSTTTSAQTEDFSISHVDNAYAMWGDDLYAQHFTCEVNTSIEITPQHEIHIVNVENDNTISFILEETFSLPSQEVITLDTHSHIPHEAAVPQIMLSEDNYFGEWLDEAEPSEENNAIVEGVGSYRIQIRHTDEGLIGETDVKEYLNWYSGDLIQQGESEVIDLSLPVDVLPSDTNIELQLHNSDQTYDLAYDENTDTFTTTIDSTKYYDGNYGWSIDFSTPDNIPMGSMFYNTYAEDNEIIMDNGVQPPDGEIGLRESYLEDDADVGGVGAMFRQNTQTQNNALFIIGAATAGLGYLGYKRFRTGDKSEISGKTKSKSSKTHETSPSINTINSPSLSIEQYDELDIGDLIERHSTVEITYATTNGEPVWVLTPKIEGETIDSSQFDVFLDCINPWTRMDSHTNLFSVYGSGSRPLPWVAVEPPKYPSQLNQNDHVTTREILQLLTQACDAIHHIQRYGLAYEYLSVDSILVNDGTAKLKGVLDHITDNESSYALPNADEDTTTEQADVYRLGALAYEVLTGSQPVHPDPSPPSEQDSSVSAALDAVILTALAEAPEDRYETVLHLRDELEDQFDQV